MKRLNSRIGLLLLSFLFAICISDSDAQRTSQSLIKEVIKEKLLSNKFMSDRAGDQIRKRDNEEYKFTGNFDQSIIEGEPCVVINPTDSNNIVVAFMHFQGTALHMPIYASFDGGDSWFLSAFNTLAHYKLDSGRTAFPVVGGGDPVLCFDATGKLYFFWIYLGIGQGAEGRWHNFWAQSDDGGLNFSTAGNGEDLWNSGSINIFSGQINNGGDGIFDRYWCAVDQSGGSHHGSVYIAGLFIGNDTTTLQGDGIVVRIKRPGHSTFERRNIKASIGPNAQFANLLVDGNGWIHLVYGDIDREVIRYHVSRDGGENFQSSRVIGDFKAVPSGQRAIHDRENAAPFIALSDENTIHVCWTNLTDPPSAMIINSYDLGNSWNRALSLTEFVESSNFNGSFMPTMTTSNKGHVSIFMFALSDKIGAYVHLESKNKGAVFKLKEIISEGQTDFQSYSINDPFNETFFGDYNTSQRQGCMSYAVFSDGRHDQGSKVYLSRVNHCDNVTSNKIVHFTDDRVNLFPNPTYKNWTLSFDAPLSGTFRLRIMSTTSNDKTIDLHSGNNQVAAWMDLNSGSYTIEISNSHHFWIAPLVIH
jgi:hypothetical protein